MRIMQSQNHIYIYSLSLKALQVNWTFLDLPPSPPHSCLFPACCVPWEANFYGSHQPGPFPMTSDWVWPLEATNRRSHGWRRESSGYLFSFSAGPHFGHGFSPLQKATASVEKNVTASSLQP